MLERYRTYIDYLIKALTAAFPLAIFIWLFTLIGLLNSNPYQQFSDTTMLMQTVQFGYADWAVKVFLPIFLLALIFSAVAEKRLSNSFRERLGQTVIGSLFVAAEATAIAMFAGFAFLLSAEGVIIFFWTAAITLWVTYIELHGRRVM
jgi:hypothetical protein